MRLESLEERRLLSTTWFVNSDYTGTSDGSFAHPFVNPQDAVVAASAGDTISLKSDAIAIYHRIVANKSNLTINSYTANSTDPTQPVFNTGKAKVAAAAADVAALYITPLVEDASGNAISPAQIVQNITVRNLDLSNGYYAVKIEGQGANFEDDKNVVISNCDIHNSQNDVIKVTPGANNVTIADSFLHDSDMSNGGNAEGIDAVNADNFVARNNRIWNISTNGIYVKGGSQNTMIEDNRVWNTGYGGILLGQDTDTTWFDSDNPNLYESIDGTIRNNIIRTTGGSGIGLWAAYQPQVYNNTVLDGASSMQGGLYITEIHNTPTVSPTIYNNIFATANTTRNAVQINAASLQGTFTSDNNVYFQKGGDAKFVINGNNPVDFATWQSTMNADANGSANIDPMLSTDGYLTSGSTVAIDKGRVISGWTNPTDIQGDPRDPTGANPWDIGADEYTGATVIDPTPPPTFVPAWTNIPFASQSRTFTFSFDATPQMNDSDVVMGLSKGAASSDPDLAVIVRFNSSGFIDARNSKTYIAATSVPYTAGTTYHFELSVNVSKHVYTAYVTPAGGSKVLLGQNYAFRYEQRTVKSLANFGRYNELGDVAIPNSSILLNGAPIVATAATTTQTTNVALAPTTTTLFGRKAVTPVYQ